MDQYHIQDARSLTTVVKQKVDVIITSPPYFDLKDYGSSNQIGFGQQYDDYMQDMNRVLQQCFEVTSDSGCMWMVVDTLKKEGNLKLLPFDIVSEAQKTGWMLKDIIIWKKDRTLPFSRRGEMRNIFEYVLYFVKSTDFKYYPERISSLDIKEWWIKYPERYALNGKAMTDVWDFPIPVQGSWGDSYVRHFCPLPRQMIDQIIQLCSDEGDVVFDPFAGSGAVLAEAHRLNRKFIGCDLNPQYRDMFYNYLPTVAVEDPAAKDLELKALLGSTLTGLRILKWPSALLKTCRKADPRSLDNVQGVIIKPTEGHDLALNNEVEYTLIMSHRDEKAEELIRRTAARPPLTKYGLKPTLSFTQKLRDAPLWEYQWASTHTPPKKFQGETFPFIASDVALSPKERKLVDNYLKRGKLVLR